MREPAPILRHPNLNHESDAYIIYVVFATHTHMYETLLFIHSRKTYLKSAKYFIVLSRGTTHKPPPRDKEGFPVDEADSMARYLMKKHAIAKDRILMETWSLDTIGNAYFTAAMITKPLRLNNLVVVTSTFHNTRTEAIFKWVWGVVHSGASLAFTPSADDGLTDEQLSERRAKEAVSLKDIAAKKEQFNTEASLAAFIFLEHGAYAAKGDARIPTDTESLVGTYRH